ncbi:DNA methyltransferase [Epilithonimonas hispanica]|uniref:site-specific DNA-methyltransferase (adenine-specific) n=1 Tax=Epilithonimonas hispanica TaxID=358687 RepID=A0A3D9D456_9FLAO|nr:site-specific DNA-methyltransferase [Epilithonimonas hispanica]REC72793.1 site-specific DNA-methyltransferase [Epilithonimonas hispanica]
MKLYQTLESQLKKEPNYVSDNGELKKWVVLNKAQNFDEELIGLLLDNSDLKQKFFIEIKSTLIFNQNLFIQFLEQKNYLNDSYTQFKNKIGLSIDGKYLKQRNEVALVWPFKDCILEGGQSREEDKREEIFFNETLAQDEITELLDPKVLTNAKLFDKDGEKDFIQFNRNEKGTITDNLIIKGNNLLALHSLKKEFAGKVKLIYIDPPYNTGNDGFKYNDNFNHSTWLTFMRNRLQEAFSLLSEKGAIYVHIDHHQLGYLNILLDEVFGKNNKVQIIALKTASPAGFKTVNPGPIDVTEYILFYTKNKSKFEFKKGYVPVSYNSNYNLYLDRDENVSKWKFTPLKEKVINDAGFANLAEAKKKYGDLWNSIIKVMIEDFAYKNSSNVVSIRDPHKPTEKLKELMAKSKNEERVIEYEREDGSKMHLYKGGALAFYSNKMQELDGKMEVTELLTDFWNHISWAGIANEGGVKLKNGKKPEKLIKQIIELTTNENDIVLDYHLGSGTTCAVAHKMNRQYIGIEQLNYGENDSVVRLKNVINSDKTGISKSVNWQGGGSFIYLELKKYNQTFIEKIEEAENSESLLQIWEEMKSKSFLNYNVDIQKQEQHIEDFKLLNLNEQKQHLCELLNKNQLYVNLSSLNDENFECTKEEKKVTKDFYQIKN